jgi:hypothetical protein
LRVTVPESVTAGDPFVPPVSVAPDELAVNDPLLKTAELKVHAAPRVEVLAVPVCLALKDSTEPEAEAFAKVPAVTTPASLETIVLVVSTCPKLVL